MLSCPCSHECRVKKLSPAAPAGLIAPPLRQSGSAVAHACLAAFFPLPGPISLTSCNSVMRQGPSRMAGSGRCRASLPRLKFRKIPRSSIKGGPFVVCPGPLPTLLGLEITA
jgi:hypothetical protein